MKNTKKNKTMKNKTQIKNSKQIKRKKQNKKNKMVKTNTTSIQSFRHLKNFLLQLQMLGRMIALLFSPEWLALKDSIPGFKAACDKLKTLVDALNKKYDLYRRIIKTVAEQKKLAKQALAETGYRIMSSCRSYAVKNGLTDLAGKMDVNLSDLLGMKYKDLLSLMNNASALILPLIPLTDFNITQPVYDAWQTKIQDAQSLEDGPKSAIAQRKSIGGNLLIDMKQIMDFFTQELLPLATNFRSNTNFWFNFVTAKRIGKPDSRHSRLLAHCQDDLGEPIYGITITVDTFTDPNTGKSYKSASAVTDPQGDAEVIEFFAGNRTVTLSGPNIQTTTFPAIQFERGKTISHTFPIRPRFANIPAPQESKEKATK